MYIYIYTYIYIYRERERDIDIHTNTYMCVLVQPGVALGDEVVGREPIIITSIELLLLLV